MNLYIFNPEHDLALAFNKPNFTPPHAAQVFRRELGFISAFFAESGDYVVVEDCDIAKRKISKFNKIIDNVNFIALENLSTLINESNTQLNIVPWGWDKTIKERLINYGVPENLLPTDIYIERIKELSHRQTSQTLLKQLTKIEQTIGESKVCNSLTEVEKYIEVHKQCVLKTPWSCSGRGVRYVNDEISQSLFGWINNALNKYGSIMIEPYYNKVCDFAMEFSVDKNKEIVYNGLSVFATANNSYVGSVLASEEYKENILNKYIPVSLLNKIKQEIIQEMTNILNNDYIGKFGVDMMIVKHRNKLQVHPCVEINLRSTMGHVALVLSTFYKESPMIMNVLSREKCNIRLSMIENNFVNVL